MGLNVAIVGLGGIGNTHARIYHGHPECTIVAVCDMIREKADKAAETYQCKAFNTVADMINSGLKIDAVSVCTAGVENGVDHYAPTI